MANVAELLAILDRLTPDVIFAEIPAAQADQYRNGSHGTSMRELADACGVNVAALSRETGGVALSGRETTKVEAPEDAVYFATAALMKKLLHKPSVTLRKAGETSDRELIESARRLFGLDKD